MKLRSKHISIDLGPPCSAAGKRCLNHFQYRRLSLARHTCMCYPYLNSGWKTLVEGILCEPHDFEGFLFCCYDEENTFIRPSAFAWRQTIPPPKKKKIVSDTMTLCNLNISIHRRVKLASCYLKAPTLYRQFISFLLLLDIPTFLSAG